MQRSWRGSILELGWRNIPESRMKSLLIIDTLQEFADTGASVMEIAVFVAVDLLVFQRFHEGFAGRIVVRVSFAAHADGGAVLLQHRSVVLRSVLHTAIGVVHQASS